VFRSLFRDQSPRHRTLQVVALELEYPYNWQDPDCYLWFLADRLPGYAWYVPKARGYLNIGVGGSVHRLKNNGDDIQRHWQLLIARLQKQGLIDQQPAAPHGYSYYLRGSNPLTRIDNAFIVGDAVGLATRDLCEGIGPAVRSGIAAAADITSAAGYSTEGIPPFTSRFTLINRALESVYLRKSNEPKIQLPARRAA
jgi:flavin-dependent dehydrogenase